MMENLPTIIYKSSVLGPWLWPRPFLFLALKGSVIEKSVLGLGLGFFSSPWPQRLCSRLHLSTTKPIHNVRFIASVLKVRPITFQKLLQANHKHDYIIMSCSSVVKKTDVFQFLNCDLFCVQKTRKSMINCCEDNRRKRRCQNSIHWW